MLGTSDDGECDETWSVGEYEAECRRYAVVTVDGVNYCEKHAQNAPVTDR